MLGLKLEVARLWGVEKEHDVTIHRRTPRGMLSKTFRKFASI
jgi:hypothetical protein